MTLRSLHHTALGLAALLALVLALSTSAQAQAPETDQAKLAKVVEKGLTQECIGDVRGAEATWTEVLETAERLLGAKPTHTFYLLAKARALFGLDDYAAAAKAYDEFESVLAMYQSSAAADYPWTLVYKGLAQARLGNSHAVAEAWNQVPPAIGKMQQLVRGEVAGLPSGPSQQELNAAAGRVESALLQAQARALSANPEYNPLQAIGGVAQGTGSATATSGQAQGGISSPTMEVSPEGMTFGVGF